MKIYLLLTMMVFMLNTFSQNSANFSGNAEACIVDINDTIVKPFIPPVVEMGMTYKYVVGNFKKPNKRVVMKNNKVKFIYDDCYIYFNNGVVDLIYNKVKKNN